MSLLSTQIPDFSIKDACRNTRIAGWLLLSRPVIYFIFSRKRDLDSYSAVDFSAMIFILYAVVSLIVGYRIIFGGKNSSLGRDILFRSPMVLFMTYSLLGIISMAWSVLPSLTGFRAFECIAMMILIIAAIQELFETENMQYVIVWSLLYCAWNIFWEVLHTAQWDSNLSALLEASQMMSTIFFFMALYFVPLRWYNYLIMIMAVFSMSTVSYIGMAIGAISSFWTRGHVKIMAIGAAFILLLAAIAIGPSTLVKDTIFFDKNDISMEETSGRDAIMDVCIECIEMYPMGLGFFAAEPFILYNANLQAISAHNSLFSAGMGMGIPGVVILSLFFLGVGYTTFSNKIDKNYKPILIGCFFVAILHCMGNPSVGTRVFGAWMACMYIFVLICSFYVYGKKYQNDYSNEQIGDIE